MDILVIEIIVLIIFTALSAFFSGSETALFSLKKSDLHRFSVSEIKKEKSLSHFMKKPHNILITVLIGNMFVNLIVSALSTKLLLERWSRYGHFLSIAIVTPVIILLCEISPKIISINSYEFLSKKFLPLLKFFHVLFYPLRIFLLSFTDLIIRAFKLKMEHDEITKDELDYIMNVGEEKGVIDKEENAFIKNILRFSKKEASNIMFPRNRAVFLPCDMTIEDAMKVFLESGIIRAPVYKNDFDHVVGMVDSRELMPSYLGYRKAKKINRFIRNIDFFPASRELNDLLNDFISRGIQLAVVVDEFGGTAGVVTFNAILSELMGKGFTKWEVDYKPEVRRIDDCTLIISGEMQIDDFNLNFGMDLESSNADTMGGFFIEKFGHFPKRGEEIVLGDFMLRVRYIRNNRIETLELVQNENRGHGG